MATILEFKPGCQSRANAEGDARQTAELIFFPGVRYERHEPAELQPPRRKRRRQHEMMELPD